MLNLDLKAGIIFIAIVSIAFFLSLVKIRQLRTQKDKQNFHRIGLIYFISGILLTVISGLICIKIEKDIGSTIELIKPMSEMTSEPVKCLMLILMFFGLLISFIGVNYWFRAEK